MNALTGTSAAAAASAKPTSLLGRNFNSFVNILAAQIKNQDPLAPMDTHEFTNQLVQFTQVQEMMELSGSFKAISAQMADGNLVSAGQLVGRNITFKSDVVHLAGGHAEIPHTLGAGAAGAAITIKSEGGSVVRTLRETAGPGERTVAWDGLDDRGNAVPDGIYKVEIQARDLAGNAVQATSKARSAVAAAFRRDAGIIELSTSIGMVKLSDVLSLDSNS